MLENINDGIKILAEDQSALRKELRGMREDIGSLDEKIDATRDSLSAKIDKAQNDITEIKYELKHKADYDDFEKLEKRMIKVERVVFSKKFA